uniref:Uridine diphosphate glucose pyrophosphatase NUDT14 n=1 Tax=Petromyzon marinus TaxID=7757 RepID=A0AAJ7X289_PETMA|nr:uridine diphosphate glucose pyrophosphatase NUDT14 [Petromyzon marinus]
MDDVSGVSVEPCAASRYLRPHRISYTQNGVRKTWDFMETHDSVAILLFNTTRRCFVFVKQFRPAVYVNEREWRRKQRLVEATEAAGTRVLRGARGEGVGDEGGPALPGSAGVTCELCAGILDHPGVSAAETARLELMEECGYDVPLEELHCVTSYRTGVGVSGARQTLYYAAVTDAMHTGPGGGRSDEGELIELMELPLEHAAQFMDAADIERPLGVLYGLLWFLSNVAPSLPNTSPGPAPAVAPTLTQ